MLSWFDYILLSGQQQAASAGCNGVKVKAAPGTILPPFSSILLKTGEFHHNFT
jgi:hypothetical protein